MSFMYFFAWIERMRYTTTKIMSMIGPICSPPIVVTTPVQTIQKRMAITSTRSARLFMISHRILRNEILTLNHHQYTLRNAYTYITRPMNFMIRNPIAAKMNTLRELHICFRFGYSLSISGHWSATFLVMNTESSAQ